MRIREGIQSNDISSKQYFNLEIKWNFHKKLVFLVRIELVNLNYQRGKF